MSSIDTRPTARALKCLACGAAVAVMVGLTALPGSAAEIDGSKIASALGKSGTAMPGGVYRVGLPRTDLHVTLDGVELKAGFALGSWLAFRADGNATMVMGDLVLTEAEIPPVMTKLAEGGIEITALHNHLLRAQPATFYMHVLGHGDAVTLATALHDGLALSKTPLGDAGAGAAAGAAPPIDLDTAMIDSTLGAKGRAAGGVYQFGIARAETIKDGGMEVPVAMGSAEAINFQPTGSGKAAITGDFVLTAAEVNPVLGALRQNGIEVTALHNHMLDDQPRLFFMHFWANDDAQKLAKGLRAALDKINNAPQLTMRWLVVLLIALFCMTGTGLVAEPPAPLVLERTIALKGVTGRIDHLAVDLARKRLFVAELGNGTVDVIDLVAGNVTRRIEGLKEPQGLAYSPAADILAVASAGDGSVRLFRGAELSPAGTVDLGDDADNIRLDAGTGNLVVGYGSGGLAVIDPAKASLLSRIPLPAHPEGFQLDPANRRAFVNVPNARQIAVVDLNTGRQTASWRLPDLGANFPMAFDAAQGMVAGVFRNPARLVIFDVNTGKPTGTFKTCGDADDVFFDAKRRRRNQQFQMPCT